MANLSQLIDARRTLEAQGISIANDVDKQIKKEEDRLIQEELYRAMRNALRDTLSVLDQPITFTLHYDPANPSTYTIEHRRTGELSSEEEAAQREAREARRLKLWSRPSHPPRSLAYVSSTPTAPASKRRAQQIPSEPSYRSQV